VLLRHVPVTDNLLTPAAEHGEGAPDIEVPLLITGDSVMHAKFGLGTVQSTMGSGSKAEAIVDFGGRTRHLVLRYAPLEKLPGPAAQDAVAG
jgi:DNA helicase-2/ATP-dependent DNA helicase PcrA